MKHTDGACSSGYLGGASGKQSDLHACQQSCSATPECLFASFCPSGTAGCTGHHENKCALYSSCASNSGHAGYTTYHKAGHYHVVDGVNTTHRTSSSAGNRCTLHLDIHFPAKPRCVECPPPIPGPCEEPWISSNYVEYDSKLPVPGLDDENECHPDLHQQWWAYSRAECRPCPELIGRPTKPVTKFLGTCTCTMTSDNDIDYVYVDGVDMTRQETNYNDLGNWPTNNQLTFECSELTKMAVQASDGNGGSSAGCAGGGFGMKCSSTVKESPWHGLSTGSHWKAWGAQCTTVPCKYGGSGDDKNTFSPPAPSNWFAKDFDDSNWKLADSGNYIGKRTGATATICSKDGPGWLFRSPDFV